MQYYLNHKGRVEVNKLRFVAILASLMIFSVYLAGSASAGGVSVYDRIVKFNSAIFGVTGAQVAEGTASSEVPIDRVSLHSVTIDNENLRVVYSKNFDTCAHLLNSLQVLVHKQNLFCQKGEKVEVVKPLSYFSISEGQSVKLCHGNNYGICSGLVTVAKKAGAVADLRIVDDETSVASPYPDISFKYPYMAVVNENAPVEFVVPVENNGNTQVTGLKYVVDCSAESNPAPSPEITSLSSKIINPSEKVNIKFSCAFKPYDNEEEVNVEITYPGGTRDVHSFMVYVAKSDETKPIAKNSFFVLGNKHALEYVRAKAPLETSPATFRDIVSGASIEAELSKDGSGKINIGGKSYLFIAASATSASNYDIKIDLDGDGKIGSAGVPDVEVSYISVAPGSYQHYVGNELIAMVTIRNIGTADVECAHYCKEGQKDFPVTFSVRGMLPDVMSYSEGGATINGWNDVGVMKLTATIPPLKPGESRSFDIKLRFSEAGEYKFVANAGSAPGPAGGFTNEDDEHSLNNWKEISSNVLPKPETKCTDSDDGVDYYVKGVAKDSMNAFEDKCATYIDGKFEYVGGCGEGSAGASTSSASTCGVSEAYCYAGTAGYYVLNGGAGPAFVSCPYGCSEGACLKQEGSKGFTGASWQCYDGSTGAAGGSEGICFGEKELRSSAEEACKESCSKETGKCGVNSFSVSGECELKTTEQCTESDGGLDYYKYGKTSGIYNGLKGYTWDYCTSGAVDSAGSPVNLVEFYCIDKQNYDAKPYLCPNGCNFGACVSEQELPALDLSNYPYPFVNGGKSSFVIVVGSTAPSDDVIASVDIATGLQKGNAAVTVGLAKLDTEIADPFAQNVIAVGTPCANKVTSAWWFNAQQSTLEQAEGGACHFGGLEENSAMIKLLKHKGSVGLIVSGTNSRDTRKAAKVLLDYKTWQQKGDFKGLEVWATGTSFTDLAVTQPGVLPGGDETPSGNYVYDVQLKKGWNLVGLGLFSLNSGNDAFETSCKWLQEKNYPSYLKSNLFGYDALSRRYVSGEELHIKDPSAGDYLVNSYFNSFWLRSTEDCSIIMDLSPEAESGELFKLLQRIPDNGYKLAKGWNFFAVWPEMEGKTLDDVRGDCVVKRAYAYDPFSNRWTNLKGIEFSHEAVGYGFVMKVADDCVLGSSSALPPPLPEEDDSSRNFEAKKAGITATATAVGNTKFG